MCASLVKLKLLPTKDIYGLIVPIDIVAEDINSRYFDVKIINNNIDLILALPLNLDSLPCFAHRL